MAYWHNNYTVLETMEFLNENLTLPGNLTDIEFNKAIYRFLLYGFFPEYKLKLSPGVPEYTPKKVEHPSQLNGLMWGVPNSFGSLSNPNGSQSRRNRAFLRILSSVSESDAIFLLGVKDQTLDSMYENLSREALLATGLFSHDKIRTRI